jgi:hypothetical protein
VGEEADEVRWVPSWVCLVAFDRSSLSRRGGTRVLDRAATRVTHTSRRVHTYCSSHSERPRCCLSLKSFVSGRRWIDERPRSFARFS